MGLARAYPLIIIITMMLNYFMTNDLEFLMLASALIMSDIFNYVLKHWIVKPILGNKNYFLISCILFVNFYSKQIKKAN